MREFTVRSPAFSTVTGFWNPQPMRPSPRVIAISALIRPTVRHLDVFFTASLYTQAPQERGAGTRSLAWSRGAPRWAVDHPPEQLVLSVLRLLVTTQALRVVSGCMGDRTRDSKHRSCDALPGVGV